MDVWRPPSNIAVSTFLKEISFYAFYTQYSNIPLFHHSMWLPNLGGHIKTLYFQQVVEVMIVLISQNQDFGIPVSVEKIFAVVYLNPSIFVKQKSGSNGPIAMQSGQ
jgi:hypothetical protein